MRLYPGLAIVAHVQYSELNELKWCQWLRSRILLTIFYLLAKNDSQSTARTQCYFFLYFLYILSYNHFRENPSEKIVLGKNIIILLLVGSKHQASEGVFYIGGSGFVCQIIEPVTFARCTFIFALRNIALGGYLDTCRNI